MQAHYNTGDNHTQRQNDAMSGLAVQIDQRVIETSQPGSRSIAKWNLGNKNHDAKGVDARASHRWKALAELSLKQASNFENEKNLNPQDGSKFR